MNDDRRLFCNVVSYPVIIVRFNFTPFPSFLDQPSESGVRIDRLDLKNGQGSCLKSCHNTTAFELFDILNMFVDFGAIYFMIIKVVLVAHFLKTPVAFPPKFQWFIPEKADEIEAMVPV